MDFLTKHTAAFPRRLKAAAKVGSIGFVPGKNDIVTRTFSTYNFSFIFSGTGFYHRDGVRYEIKAPCVITQCPGIPMYYGPYRSWDEIFIIYEPDELTELEHAKIWNDKRFLWHIFQLEALEKIAAELAGQTRKLQPGMAADMVDILAFAMLSESLLDLNPESGDSRENAIRELARKMAVHPELDYNFEQCAAELNISCSGFRSHFREYLKCPPGEYLLRCRIDAARRMLSESTVPIGEIACRCGFNDQMYFSRRFRLTTGLTPSQYRKIHRYS